MKRQNIIHELRNIIAMLSRIESIAVVEGKNPSDAISDSIERMEKELYISLNRKYRSLKRQLADRAEEDIEKFKKRIKLDPALCSPIIVPSQTNTRLKYPVYPFDIFTSNNHTVQMIPTVCQINKDNPLPYHSEFLSGLMTRYCRDRDSLQYYNQFTELIIKRHDCLVQEILEICDIDGSTFQRSDSLCCLYNPRNTRAFDFMVSRDPSILHRMIGKQHPIYYLYSKLASTQTPLKERKLLLPFIYHYLRTSLRLLPHTLGYVFLTDDAQKTKKPIISLIIQMEEEIYNSQQKLIWEALIPAFNGLPDTTGLFHNVLQYMPELSLPLFEEIDNKGKYSIFQTIEEMNKSISIMKRWLTTEKKHMNENDEINITYYILTSWPESIDDIIHLHATKAVSNQK